MSFQNYVPSMLIRRLFLLLLGVREFSERHTADNIRSVTEEILETWGIPTKKIAAIVTDGGRNVVKAARDICTSNDRQIHCFAHKLNLVLEHAFQQELKNDVDLNAPKFTVKVAAIDPVIHVCSWFRNSSIGRDNLKKFESLSVISYSPTRWNSIYFMLERFYSLRESIRSVLWENPDAPPMISLDDCSFIEDILPLLKVFNDITEVVSAEKTVTISRLMSINDFMLNDVKNVGMKTALGKIFKSLITEQLSKITVELESNVIIAAATVLDPRFKKTHFADPLKCSTGE